MTNTIPLAVHLPAGRLLGPKTSAHSSHPLSPPSQIHSCHRPSQILSCHHPSRCTVRHQDHSTSSRTKYALHGLLGLLACPKRSKCSVAQHTEVSVRLCLLDLRATLSNSFAFQSAATCGSDCLPFQTKLLQQFECSGGDLQNDSPLPIGLPLLFFSCW